MFVGIDVSKEKHDVCIYDKENEKFTSFQITVMDSKNLPQRFPLKLLLIQLIYTLFLTYLTLYRFSQRQQIQILRSADTQ
ncbi:MAG: hypothetical protein ACP5LR_07270, partial [Athalassotoga sp.]|uniref:hypothetical protein n=1 Tax=Athalassotoga sp. TaxID=2022597 RepID=UPI003CFD8A39